MLLVEIGITMSDFEAPTPLASGSGLCPGNNEKRWQAQTRQVPQGQSYARRLLCEFAQCGDQKPAAPSSEISGARHRTGRKRAIHRLCA